MSEQQEARFWQQAIGDEIARQCSIGAGACGNADDGSGLFEVNASLDLNGFAAAMQKVTARYLNDLRPWGYAPGSYVFTCKDCPADMDLYDKMGRLGDKRSIRCEEHARAARDATTSARNTSQIGEG